MGKKELMSILMAWLDPSKSSHVEDKIWFKKRRWETNNQNKSTASLSQALKTSCSDYNLNICLNT